MMLETKVLLKLFINFLHKTKRKKIKTKYCVRIKTNASVEPTYQPKCNSFLYRKCSECTETLFHS